MSWSYQFFCFFQEGFTHRSLQRLLEHKVYLQLLHLLHFFEKNEDSEHQNKASNYYTFSYLTPSCFNTSSIVAKAALQAYAPPVTRFFGKLNAFNSLPTSLGEIRSPV